jgi:phosphopentomutase
VSAGDVRPTSAGRRAAIVVLDGVGVGEAPDAAAYGDAGSDTLGHVAAWAARHDPGWALPNLAAAGLGHLAALAGVPAHPAPTGAWGTMRPASAGKDSTTGHWEIAGVRLARPFPTYPHGFPPELVAAFVARTGRPVIGNTAASGTAVLETYGPEHQGTGAWILYTSADSVFQVAAHEEVVPLAELYAACETARALLVAPHDVSRVIARPFVGSAGAYRRTGNRRDYSVAPPAETLLDALAAAGVPRAGVGKVDDLFAGRALSARHTAGNAEGIAGVEAWLRGSADDDLLFITADHGNDPTTASTDHARERVPLLACGRAVRPGPLGERATFADLGATVAEWLGVEFRGAGRSFLGELTARAAAPAAGAGA